MLQSHYLLALNHPLDLQQDGASTHLLDDPDFTSMIQGEWTSLLERNNSPEVTPSLSWETGKEVIRGKIISYSSHTKKEQQKLENNLE